MDNYTYCILEKVYSSYAPALLGIISRLIGEREIAETILQNTMVQILTTLKKQPLDKEPAFGLMRQLAIANTQAYLSVQEKIDQLPLNPSQSDQDLFDLVYFKAYPEKQLLLELDLTSILFRKRLRNSVLALRRHQGDFSDGY